MRVEASATEAVAWCGALGVLYVAGLYMWKGSTRRSRDEPGVIVRRFVSVGATSVASVVLLRLLLCTDAADPLVTFGDLVGVRPGGGALLSTLLALLLTATLFLGPIVASFADDGGDGGYEESFSLASFRDLQFWRALVVGPVTEEVVFRACMCPVLVGAGFSRGLTVALPPLVFGAAHAHHAAELQRDRGWRTALAATALQLCYTALFGAYSCFLFLRTGHLLACIAAHSFCNWMGFPDFQALLSHPRRAVLGAAYVAGLVLFVLLLGPLTSPALHQPPLWPYDPDADALN